MCFATKKSQLYIKLDFDYDNNDIRQIIMYVFMVIFWGTNNKMDTVNKTNLSRIAFRVSIVSLDLHMGSLKGSNIRNWFCFRFYAISM